MIKSWFKIDLTLIILLPRYEQAFLTVLIGFNPMKYFWIALSDVGEQGTFKWADGEAVLFTHWNSGMPGMRCHAVWWVARDACFVGSLAAPKKDQFG